MKLLRFLIPGPFTILCLLPFLLAATTLVANPHPASKQVELTPATARTVGWLPAFPFIPRLIES